MTAGEASQIGNLKLHLLILIKLPKHSQTIKSSLLFFVVSQKSGSKFYLFQRLFKVSTQIIYSLFSAHWLESEHILKYTLKLVLFKKRILNFVFNLNLKPCTVYELFFFFI